MKRPNSPRLSHDFIVISFACLGFLHPIAASEPQASLPPIESLRAPDKSRWEITIEPKQGNAIDASASQPAEPTANDVLVSMTGEKDGRLYHFRQQFRDGATTDLYALPHLQFTYDSKSDLITRRLADEPGSIDLAESDFPELYWVAGRPCRMEEIDGTDYLVVEIEGKEMPPTLRERNNLAALSSLQANLVEDNSPGESSEQISRPNGLFRLVLDAKTRLPLRLETPDELRTYKFSPSDGLTNKLPEAITTNIRSHQDNLRPPSAP